jgi:phosphoesterase family protein
VVFVKPDGTNNQHPGESTMAAGDLMAGTIVETLRRSPQWTRMAIIVMRTVASGTLLPRPRRPVGPRLAYPNRHRITIRKERIRGPHDLRHDVDPAIPF